MTSGDENALGGSDFRPRDLLRATTRPPWRFRSTDLGVSVDRLGVPRSTDLGFSVDRPGDFGGPTAALRSTDFADSVYRLCPPPGEPSTPAKGRINTTVGSDQYHGRVRSIRRYARTNTTVGSHQHLGMVGSISRYRRFLRYRLIESPIRPCWSVAALMRTHNAKHGQSLI